MTSVIVMGQMLGFAEPIKRIDDLGTIRGRNSAFTRLDVSPIVQGLAIAAAPFPAAPPPRPSLAVHSSTSVSNQTLNVTFDSRSSASGTPALREIQIEG